MLRYKGSINGDLFVALHAKTLRLLRHTKTISDRMNRGFIGENELSDICLLTESDAILSTMILVRVTLLPGEALNWLSDDILTYDTGDRTEDIILTDSRWLRNLKFDCIVSASHADRSYFTVDQRPLSKTDVHTQFLWGVNQELRLDNQCLKRHNIPVNDITSCCEVKPGDLSPRHHLVG